MLKRTPFKRKAPVFPAKPDRSAEFANFSPKPRPVAALLKAPAGPITPAPKLPMLVRDAEYRQLVAYRPCALCGVVGFSQAAHANFDKGLGLKTCDLTCFPACHVGANNCHGRWDSYEFGRETQRLREPVLAARTQADLINIARFDNKARRVLERVGLLKEICEI